MIGTLAVAWAGTVLASVALDTMAKPKVAAWSQRSIGMILLHMATVSWLFVLFLSLFGRAWFALACTVGLLALLVTVSNAKFNALREPVVFSDLALFAQSIRHPRLYLPYLSWMQVLALVPAVALFALTFWLDSALNPRAVVALGLVWVALFLVQIWLARDITLQLNPEQDQAQHGFLGVFVTYLLKGLSLHEIRQVQAQLNASPYANISVKTTDKSGRKNADAPDVLVIQSESFFDIRKTGLRVAPGLLGHFDALQQSGICLGALAVPAWGANTMRTEHAFLSGVSNAALRYASFYPYAFVTHARPEVIVVLQFTLTPQTSFYVTRCFHDWGLMNLWMRSILLVRRARDPIFLTRQ